MTVPTGNPDAKLWADAFLARHPECGVEHDVLLGWFANAMMAMYDFTRGNPPINGDHMAHRLGLEDRK